MLKYRDTGDTQIKYRDLSIYPLLIIPGRVCFQVLPFFVRRAEALKLYGLALKASMKQNGDGALRRENDDKRIEVCKFRLSQSVLLYRESCSYWLLNFFFQLFEKLGWDHCVRCSKESLLVKYPTKYQPF